jgi:hypothetical protein
MSFGTFFTVLVLRTKKNLAILAGGRTAYFSSTPIQRGSTNIKFIFSLLHCSLKWRFQNKVDFFA